MKKAIKLEFNGKDYTFPFGLGFIGECLNNLDLDVVEIGEKLDKNVFKWTPTLMHESHKFHCYMNDLEAEFTYKELLTWIDEDANGFEKVSTFLKEFLKSLTAMLPKEEVKKGVKKK